MGNLNARVGNDEPAREVVVPTGPNMESSFFSAKTRIDFVYLGSSLNEDSACGKEVDRRIALGTWKFSELRKSVWNQSCIGLETKMKLYQSLVLPVVLYGSESWTCTDREYAKLNAFHNKNQRSMLGRKRDEIS